MHRWILALAVSGLGLTACAKKESKRKPFNCFNLQERMETCEKVMLELIEARAQVELKTGGARASDAQARAQRLQQRLLRKIRKKSMLKTCEYMSRRSNALQRRQMSRLQYCYGLKGCRAFGRCYLER